MALAFEDKQGADRKRKGTKYFVAPYKGLQDSLGFWIPRQGFQILCQWNLDSGFQALEGFRIP